jgi:hypothetical protein
MSRSRRRNGRSAAQYQPDAQARANGDSATRAAANSLGGVVPLPPLLARRASIASLALPSGIWDGFKADSSRLTAFT